MKTRYLDLMEKILSAYSNNRIVRYFDEVRNVGLTEHGFPRLTANIGILIANGRREDLLPIFMEMMEFCCKTIPRVKAANDFSVREIVCCILELEDTQVVPQADIVRWKGCLATIDCKKCYNIYARTPTERPNNWALFTGVSEYVRQSLGICDSSDFVEVQIASQLQRFDENGMYMDEEEIYNPITYDLVSRGLCCLLLFFGYRGRYYEKIDVILKKSGLLMLRMQSVTGEMAFGGRSNQFLHNEAWLAAIFEYEACRYKREGALALAGAFKVAAKKAVQHTESWLAKNTVSHVKNHFPIDSKYGCESYAYFDKYMITAASFYYAAKLFCDDTIEEVAMDSVSSIWSTSSHFHKVFVRYKDYFLEFDTNADPSYDASGLGRIHREGAPSAICLSVPFPGENSHYSLGDKVNKMCFAIAPSVKTETGIWQFASTKDSVYRLASESAEEDCAKVQFDCELKNGTHVKFFCCVEENVVRILVHGSPEKEIGLSLPIFDFDGEKYTKTTFEKGKIIVEYEDWICEYESETIVDLNMDFANRNGVYKGYLAQGTGEVETKIKIYKSVK